MWQRCDAAGNACSPVGTSTNSAWGTTVSRTLTAADAGRTFRVQVVAVNSAGSGVAAVSGATAVIGTGVPVLTGAPSIGGSPVVGGVLTATSGSWFGSPTNFWLVWERCDGAGNACVTIGTSTNYAWGQTVSRTLTTADLGWTFRVRVVAVNGVGSGAEARSGASAAIAPRPTRPTVLTAPTLTGSGRPGDQLTASSGVYGGTGITVSYAWYRCHRTNNSICDAIAGASSSRYVPTYGDTGARIRVTVTASNLAGSVSTTRYTGFISSIENNCWVMNPSMAQLTRDTFGVRVARLSSGFRDMKLCYRADSNLYVPEGGGEIVLSSTIENVGIGGLLLHESFEHAQPTLQMTQDRWGRTTVLHRAHATEKFSCGVFDPIAMASDVMMGRVSKALQAVCDLVDVFALDYDLGWIIAPGGLRLYMSNLSWKVDQGDALKVLVDTFTSSAEVPFVSTSDRVPPGCMLDSNGKFNWSACQDAMIREVATQGL